MARWGRVDFRQLQRLQKRMQKLQRVDYEKFCEDAAKELAARFLAKVIRRTPVGIYEDGIVGGTLRRGWTAKSHREAELSATFGGSTGVKKFADSMVVTKKGNVYEIEVLNPVEYSMYVEYGHRTANHKGWVKGRFMMTISADEVQAQAPQIVEKKLMEILKEAFDGD
ncbi:HK97 gp10 family phage protein [Bacillus sp. S/N-304-OC-R1]|uniref:HK97 gp10 family phage protein n=1 Tax=Bacillus sp. S/N-304-OC-R1 TaxID=2758034 RepID=UPI001C8DE912|nr:HK97 gp10 family phage protein [Bacillus sp. S/N-304-OC-R1]MBY0122156.1 HK97 gp10 family phage protein [Bacillus sp. S/N-304-OC-R1]